MYQRYLAGLLLLCWAVGVLALAPDRPAFTVPQAVATMAPAGGDR
jgi:hypothetical protein